MADAPGALHSAPSQQFPSKSYVASFLELYLMGILVTGKSFTFWQSGFTMGYGPFFMSVGSVCLAYLCFTSCVAEMTSLLPFSGGSYGYVRCVMGPLLGYLIGFFESMEYIMFVSATLAALGRILTTVLGTSSDMQPVYWLIFYVVAIPFQIVGGSLFWKAGGAMAVWILGILLVYCLGNAAGAHMTSDRSFVVGSTEFMRFYAVAGWCFKGIELMTLTCDQTSDPAKRVPRAMVASVYTITLFVLCMTVIMGSIAPGPDALTKEKFPLDPGLTRVFGIDEKYAALLVAPGIAGTAYCFLFAASKQLFAMASSGLVPPTLKLTFGSNQSPVAALVVVALLSFAVEVVLFFELPDAYLSVLFTLSMMSSLPVYLALMAAYCIYANKFDNMERKFTSAFGRAGALYAMLVYGFAAIALIAFPKELTVSTSFFCVSTFLTVLYYVLVAQKRQCFSTEEQVRFLKVYVVNASRKRRKGRAAGRGAASTAAVQRRPSLLLRARKVFSDRAEDPAESCGSGDSSRSAQSKGVALAPPPVREEASARTFRSAGAASSGADGGSGEASDSRRSVTISAVLIKARSDEVRAFDREEDRAQPKAGQDCLLDDI